MNHSNPWPLVADSREAGVPCPHCDIEIRRGEKVASCPVCGQVQHWSCWDDADGCGSYDCSPARRHHQQVAEPTLRISIDELDAAVPLPAVVRNATGVQFTSPAATAGRIESRTNRLAVVSLVIAVLGIPLFGLITGLVAIVLGSIALGSRARFFRGSGFAVAGVLLGVADMVGWVVFLSFSLSQPETGLRLLDFEPGSAELEAVVPHVRRAMKANVLIESRGDFPALTGASVGSGVILQINNGNALIVTNRHVIDNNFASGGPSGAAKLANGRKLSVKLIGQLPQPGQVVWVAPEGIDLALLQVPTVSPTAMSAIWDPNPKLAIGDEVFAIGNPHALGWTHTPGGISQFRSLTSGNRKIRVIQTSAAINADNSGGGLYDKTGKLIGINTWTNDKRVSEGLSFAITLDTLLELAPPRLNQGAGNNQIQRD